MAKRLTEQRPDKPAPWRALAAARYGTEDWQGAIAALEKALQLSNDGDGTERFFLAMALWHMGKKQEARTIYEQAVQWMEKYKPQHYELRRLREQAAQLLNPQS